MLHRVGAADVTCSVVCMFGTWVSCASTDEPIEMLFCGLTPMGTRNSVLDEDQDWIGLILLQPQGTTRQ